MGTTQAVIQATLRPDGTLELDERPDLPPGRVRVIVQAVDPAPAPGTDRPDDPFWSMMERIWAGQEARGHVARTEREIEALRDEAEAELLEVERLDRAGDRADQPGDGPV